MSHKPKPASERLWSRVKKGGPDECWEWQGGTDKDGYGKIRHWREDPDRIRKGKPPSGRTHILAWMLANNAEYPNDMLILHHCDNPPCVNPGHLYAGTPADNARDASERKRHAKAQWTHCKRGHEFTEENIFIKANGCRACKKCIQLRAEWRRQGIYVSQGDEPPAIPFNENA